VRIIIAWGIGALPEPYEARVGQEAKVSDRLLIRK